MTAWQNLWKAEPWKSAANVFAAAQTLKVDLDAPDELQGSMTLKFAASGAVTASARFVTGVDARTGREVVHTASCSSVLIPLDENIYALFVCFPPKSGKFDGYSSEIYLGWDGERRFIQLEQ